MPDDVLRLEVTEFTDLTEWRWRLTDTRTGAFLADHDVELAESDWQFEAFGDLRHYLSWHATDDTYAVDETRIVTEAGDWAGERVFGTAIMQALARHRNATVRVTLPADAEALAFLPLELARADGQTLAALGITLVIETGDAPARPPEPVGERLRVLGLFSLPEQSSPLNLRRERRELVRLIETIAAPGRAADVTVLQYGVTRDRLRDVLEEAEGWDIIHVSGHGAPGELLLEIASGDPDRVTADDLADLLDLARGRVKLVTLSACWSAALTANEQRRLLRLPVPDKDQTRSSPERIAATAQSPGALATKLTSRLDCAVLAMRYPVNDDFAIALAAKLYALLAGKGHTLPRAVAMALGDLGRGDRQGRMFPALSMAAPAVFGATAAELVLRAPDRAGSASYAIENLKMAGFPPPPERFVGRTGVMARALAALAAQSRDPGVLLHGMPGGGKTSCALELAYGHEDAFDRLAWFKAPDEDSDISAALKDFALALERDLPGFQMSHVLADDRKLDDFLPRLTELIERKRLLIVIDNAESLLSDGGQWRDERWGKVFGALTGHAGYGKVIVTSRRVPDDTHGLRVEPVDALSLDEALLLARELPSLRKLIYGELAGIDQGTARKLALGVLNVAQGHPKLLELADGQAADPQRLGALVQAGDQAWQDQGGLPDGFFTTGETNADPGDYLRVLAAWTESVTGTLSPGARDLFWFLCCLEEPDRERFVLDSNWTDLWQRLGRDGQPPSLNRALAELAVFGLTTTREETADENKSYTIHPGVTAAGRDHAGPDFQTAVDTEVGDFWYEVCKHASGKNDDGSVDTRHLVRAGLAAVPYLLRQERWHHAADVLEDVFLQDPSRASAVAMLPSVTRIADHDPRHEGTLLLVLQVLDPDAAGTRLRAYVDASVARGDYRAASAAAGRLIDLYRGSGLLAEALTLTGTMADYTRQAGLGPWTQLSDQGRRLQVLADMGHAEQVLDEVQELRRRMETFPDPPDLNEATTPLNVREVLLGTGRDAAARLGRWQDALDLNAEITASHRRRRATDREIARTRYNDYGPLLGLDRVDEALILLQECRQVFYNVGDIQALGSVFSALAGIEGKRDHGEAAIYLEHDALRYKYLADDVSAIAVSYHNLGKYLSIYASQPGTSLPVFLSASLVAFLTAALIHTLIGDQSASESVRGAAVGFKVGAAGDLPIGHPVNVADLCDRLARIEGTDLPVLIEKLSPDHETAERTLRDLIAQARALAEEP